MSTVEPNENKEKTLENKENTNIYSAKNKIRPENKIV